MPGPVPSTRPTAGQLAYERVRALARPLIDWKEAVRREAWRLARLDGDNPCTEAHHSRARDGLIKQAIQPPAGYDPAWY